MSKGSLNTDNMEKYFFRASAEDFKKIPGAPIAYWASQGILTAFEKFTQIREAGEPKSGLSTTDNNRFLRFWYEVDFERLYWEHVLEYRLKTWT